MKTPKYAVGDQVYLVRTRHQQAGGAFIIRAILPESDGQVQYRVRSESEGFERRISAGDIDTERARTSAGKSRTMSARDAATPWFKPLAIHPKN